MIRHLTAAGRVYEIDLTGTHYAHDAYVAALGQRLFYQELASALSGASSCPTWSLSWDERTGEYRIEVTEGG